MIDTVLNLVFRCAHRRLTRPVTPVSTGDTPGGATYVVCLDCGKKFAYDAKEMKLGKALPPVQGTAQIAPGKPKRSKLKYALWTSVPLAILVGSLWKGKREQADGKSPAPPRN